MGTFFFSKPRHVTPQIDHVRKLSHVVRVSTHIYGVSKEKDGNIFFSKPRHVTLQIDQVRKMSPVLKVSTTFMGFLRR